MHDSATQSVSQLERRQRVLADFGEFALRSDDLDEVLTQACRLVGEALGTGRAKVLEIEHESRTLFVRAGVGWSKGVVGSVRLPMAEHSSETYSIAAGAPVISNDIAQENRFDFPDFIKQAGVKALANVPIFLPGGRPYGLLQVDASEPRAFGDQDTQFLRTYATILGPVLDRLIKLRLLNEGEARHAFVLRLSDELRPLSDAEEIRLAAATVLGRRLRANRVAFAEVEDDNWFILTRNYTEDATELTGRRRFEDYGLNLAGELAAGRISIQADVARNELLGVAQRAAFAEAGIGAFLNAPLVKQGRLVALLSVHFDAAHDFTPLEIDLVLETAERTWSAVERARAEAVLRESESRFRLIVESVRDYAILTLDGDGLITSWGAGAAAVFGWSEAEILGRSVDLTFTPEDVASGEPRKERDTAIREGAAPNVRQHLRKDGSRIFIDGSIQFLASAGGKREFIKIGQDVTEARRVQQALADSEQRLRTLMEGIPQLVWRAADEGRWTWSSPQWQAFTGQSLAESLDLGWLDFVHPDDRETTLRAWDDAGLSRGIDVEHRVRRRDGEYVWHHTRSLPVRNEDGRIVEWLGTTTDVQQLKELQQRQAVLVAELQHRTRNLMAVVRAMVEKTSRASADLSDFRTRFRDRLDALSRVQALLSRLTDIDRVSFDDLIRTELSAVHGSMERVTLKGPRGVRLRSSTLQTLAMALHELATNALKYGALSQPSGRLAVTWSLERSGESGTPWLHIEWLETGIAVPPLHSPPHGAGQGRELIEQALPYQLSAKTSYDLGPEGVRCTISIPVSATA